MSELITKDMPEPKEPGIYFVTGHGGSFDVLEREPDEYGRSHWKTFGDDTYSWAQIIEWWHWANDLHHYTIESLAEHDKRIRREALTATDDELAVMEAAFDASIEKWEDDGIEAMSIAMEALAKSRERES
jgi:hypothetical protein